MNSRERVQAVLNGDVPDRIPTRLRAAPEALASLENYLGLKGDALLDRLGVDPARVSFVYNGPKELYGGPLLGGAGRDIFGIEWKPVENEYCVYMEAQTLKERFGGKLVFHGGVDEQELLPKGSPADVAAEVRRLAKILGKGGGYILSSSHSLQADTPPENIVAMFDAVQ